MKPKTETFDSQREPTAQGTIEKYIADGLSEQEAVKKWESITRVKLPDEIKCLIKKGDGRNGRCRDKENQNTHSL